MRQQVPATHSAAGSPVQPPGRADQNTLPAHHVVDIAYQITEDILVRPAVGETVREGEGGEGTANIPHKLISLSSSGCVRDDIDHSPSNVSHLEWSVHTYTSLLTHLTPHTFTAHTLTPHTLPLLRRRGACVCYSLYQEWGPSERGIPSCWHSSSRIGPHGHRYLLDG